MGHFDKYSVCFMSMCMALGMSSISLADQDATGGQETSFEKTMDTGGRMRPTSMGVESERQVYDRSVVLSFVRGKSALTKANQTKLRNLLNAVGQDNIDRIEVAAWSDKVLPKNGASLSKNEDDLADARIDHIESFLRDKLLSASEITTYNMAENTNWLARTMRADDTELKTVFSKEVSAPMSQEDFKLIQNDGAPYKAVVVIVNKMNLQPTINQEEPGNFPKY